MLKGWPPDLEEATNLIDSTVYGCVWKACNQVAVSLSQLTRINT